MKHQVITVVAVLALSGMEVISQSVVQECLIEQLRNNVVNNSNNNNNNNNLNVLNQQQQPSAELATLNAFQSICQNYPGYVDCFQSRLWGSSEVSDMFLSLLFQPQSMTIAYRGLCYNMQVIQPNIRCLLSNPEVRRCYDNFNEGVQQVVDQQTRGQLPRVILQELACNVSVARYQCETAVYSFCDQESGQVMQDFFYAGVPQQCRDTTGVTSRFVDRWGGAAGIRGSKCLHFITAFLMALWIATFL